MKAVSALADLERGVKEEYDDVIERSWEILDPAYDWDAVRIADVLMHDQYRDGNADDDAPLHQNRPAPNSNPLGLSIPDVSLGNLYNLEPQRTPRTNNAPDDDPDKPDAVNDSARRPARFSPY
ncbi:hypothetical protein ACM66B_001182 [Microbotryomycetes sp. NB124-2]